MKAKVGQYFYTLRGCHFCICRYDKVTDMGYSANPVPDEPLYDSREEARRRVYQLNGWRIRK